MSKVPTKMAGKEQFCNSKTTHSVWQMENKVSFFSVVLFMWLLPSYISVTTNLDESYLKSLCVQSCRCDPGISSLKIWQFLSWLMESRSLLLYLELVESSHHLYTPLFSYYTPIAMPKTPKGLFLSGYLIKVLCDFLLLCKLYSLPVSSFLA